jgi:hypothetical protein
VCAAQPWASGKAVGEAAAAAHGGAMAVAESAMSKTPIIGTLIVCFLRTAPGKAATVPAGL